MGRLCQTLNKMMMFLFKPLFSYEMVGICSKDHPLANKEVWQAEDFAEETWVTYPVPDDMLDLYRQVLKPKGINPPRRTTELTIALIQLVASRRGIATVLIGLPCLI